MIRLAGACLLMAGCGALGLGAVGRLDGRVRDLRELSAGLDTLQRELGWQPETSFDEGIRQTVRWYVENRDWWESIVSGRYRE